MWWFLLVKIEGDPLMVPMAFPTRSRYRLGPGFGLVIGYTSVPRSEVECCASNHIHVSSELQQRCSVHPHHPTCAQQNGENLLQEEEEEREAVFIREIRGGSSQHATRNTQHAPHHPFKPRTEAEEAFFIRESIVKEDPPTAHQAQHRSKPRVR